MRVAILVLLLSVPAMADGEPSVSDALDRLGADLVRAAPDAAARVLAGHTLPAATKALEDARELVRRGQADRVRPLLPVLGLHVRLVSVTVDAGRLGAMARSRERRVLTLVEEARVARAAFEQVVERRVEIENGLPPVVGEEPGARATNATESGGD